MGDGGSAGSLGDHQAQSSHTRPGRMLRMGFALDVVGYGARPAPLRSEVQRRLPRLAAAMLGNSGFRLENIEHEWTGDGINVVLPADADPARALPILIRTLAAQLTADNARAADRIRLRMSVGIGLVENAATGFGGPMILDLSRLVNSAPLRGALTANPDADLVAAISDQVHSAVIRPGYPGIPAAQFTPADVAEKEFTGLAWIWVSTRQWSAPALEPLARGDPRAVGDSRTGRYYLTARLGAGPASTVYLASAPHPIAFPSADPVRLGDSPAGTWVAVKVLRPELLPGPGARHRLAKGIEAAAALAGPGVARVVDAAPDAASPWIATALVPGPSLHEAVTQTGPLPPRPALWLSAGAARALAGIHHARAVHGSLRPSNVLLSPDGPVVTDAGTGWAVIAADDGTSLSHSAHPAHPSDDVLALGCVAFYAATGRTPYGEYPAGGDVIPQDADDPDLSGCPAELLPVVQACLLPPEARPDAAAVSELLGAAAGTAPPAWLPPAVASRFADYLTISPPASRARHRVSWHALRVPWRHGHRHQLPHAPVIRAGPPVPGG